MKSHVKFKAFCAGKVKAEQFAENFKVSRRADRQELGKSLHESHYKRVQYIHGRGLLFAWFKTNSHSHENESEEADGGADHNAAGAENVGIECFGSA